MSQIVISITDGHVERQLSLAGDAWPITIGSAPHCSVQLDALTAQNAIVGRLGRHNYLKALPGCEVRVGRSILSPGSEEQRVDSFPFVIGPYTITVRF
jgi:hypothetical protein